MEKKNLRGVIVESPQVATVIAQALASVGDWTIISDHHDLPPNLGEVMLMKRLAIAIIHVNKVSDELPVLTAVDRGLPVVVVTRSEKVGAVGDLKPVYQRLRDRGVPTLEKMINVIELRELVEKLLLGK